MSRRKFGDTNLDKKWHNSYIESDAKIDKTKAMILRNILKKETSNIISVQLAPSTDKIITWSKVYCLNMFPVGGASCEENLY